MKIAVSLLEFTFALLSLCSVDSNAITIIKPSLPAFKDPNLNDGVLRREVPADQNIPSTTESDPNPAQTSTPAASELTLEAKCTEFVALAIEKIRDTDTGKLTPMQVVCNNILKDCRNTGACRSAPAVPPSSAKMFVQTRQSSRTPARSSAPRNASNANNSNAKGAPVDSTKIDAPNPSNENSNSDADRQYCQSLHDAAMKCCMDPSRCGAESPVQLDSASTSNESSFPDLCKQMNSAGEADARSNINAGNLCLQKYTTCQDQCDSLANNYSGSIGEGFHSAARAC